MVLTLVPAPGSQLRRSYAALDRCRIRLEESNQCVTRTKATISRSVDVLARNGRRRHMHSITDAIASARE